MTADHLPCNLQPTTLLKEQGWPTDEKACRQLEFSSKVCVFTSCFQSQLCISLRNQTPSSHVLCPHRSEQQRPSAEIPGAQKVPSSSSLTLAARIGSQNAKPSSMSRSGSPTAAFAVQQAGAAFAQDSESTAEQTESTAGQTGRSQPGNEAQPGIAAGIVPAKWGSEQDLQSGGYSEAPEAQREQNADRSVLHKDSIAVVEPQQEHEDPKQPTEEQEKAEEEGSSSPQANAIKPAGEQSPRIPFGLATAGGSGMDFFDGKRIGLMRLKLSCGLYDSQTS